MRPGEVSSRVTRMGSDKDGRTYTINVTCFDFGQPDVTDPFNQSTAAVTVLVPHDRGH